MKKVIKITLWSLATLILVLAASASLFLYKARYGFNFYESKAPEFPVDFSGNTVLLFSKTNGFRHGEAIAAAVPAFEQLAKENDWSLFSTDNGAVFNPSQLQQVDVVIWNNTSGKVLSEGQREAFKNYLENGGGFIGIHAAGDNSHQWKWYEEKVIRAKFSHHPINPQFQYAEMKLEVANPELIIGLPSTWTHEEEWYMFFDNPRENASEIIYTIDDTSIRTSGNIPLIISGKDWWMGKDHPVVWYHPVGQGRAFYSSLGHLGSAFQEPKHLQLLKNAVTWAGQFPQK